MKLIKDGFTKDITNPEVSERLIREGWKEVTEEKVTEEQPKPVRRKKA